MSITPDDIETGGKVLDVLIQAGKWVGGTVAAAWIAARILVKNSLKAGEKKREFEELVENVDELAEDVEAIKAREKEYITLPQHETIQRNCVAALDGVINTKINAALVGLRDDMNILNGNVCRIMGALDIPPDQTVPHRRRRSDMDGGDWST